MIVQHFLKWIDTARVAERAAAANALARAYVQSELCFEDRCAAEAALTLLLDDPSPKVREAMAEPLALSRSAPPQIVAALAADQIAVAAMVLALSPLLTDGQLIDRVAAGDGEAQSLIAARPGLSMAVAAAIAEVGEPDACRDLLANECAEIAQISFRRIAERHGGEARVREALIADARLPSDIRHMLLVRVGEALRDSPFVSAAIGSARAARVTREACARGSLALIDATGAGDHPALVEHLRMRGELTVGFALRLVAGGRIDFFGAALVALSGQEGRRVQSILAGGRDGAVAAMLKASGLPGVCAAPILRALRVWRAVANGKRVAGTQEVAWLMLEAVEAEAEGDQRDEMATLLRTIHLEALRDNAREHALTIAAA